MAGADLPAAISYRPVGVVRSPFRALDGMPLQSVAGADVQGRIEFRNELAAGLQDLDGFSHLHVVSHLHRQPSRPADLVVQPFLDATPRGVFATRSPRHPNAIGLSVVGLLHVDGPTLHVAGLDLVDGTPVLDVKPYVPAFDVFDAPRAGWLAAAAGRVHHVRADGRFEGP